MLTGRLYSRDGQRIHTRCRRGMPAQVGRGVEGTMISFRELRVQLALAEWDESTISNFKWGKSNTSFQKLVVTQNVPEAMSVVQVAGFLDQTDNAALVLPAASPYQLYIRLLRRYRSSRDMSRLRRPLTNPCPTPPTP